MLDKLATQHNRYAVIGLVALLLVLTLFAYSTSVAAGPLLDEIYLLEFLKARSSHSVMYFLTSMIDWTGPLPEDTWGIVASSLLSLLSNVSSHSLSFLRCVSIAIHVLNAALLFFVIRDSMAAAFEDEKANASYLAGCAAVLFAVYPLAPEAVSWLGGLAYEIGLAFWLYAFYMYLKGKRERNWTIVGVGWISFLLAVLSDSSLWSSGFIIVALELAKSFIGPHKHNENARVPTEDEVFEDAVDKMLEDEHRGLRHREFGTDESENVPTGGETKNADRENANAAQSGSPNESAKASENESTNAGESASANRSERERKNETGTSSQNESSSDGNKEPSVYEQGDSPDELFDTLTPALPFIVLGVLISIRALPQSGNEQLPSDMVAGFSDWIRVFKSLFYPVNQTLPGDHAAHITALNIFYGALSVVSLGALVRNARFRQNAAFLFAWLIMIIVPHLHTTLEDFSLANSRLAYSALVPATAAIALAIFAPMYLLAGSQNERKLKPLFAGLITLLSGFAVVMSFSQTVQQNIAYKSGAETLSTITRSIGEFSKYSKFPFSLIIGMPGEVALGAQVTPDRIIAVDTEKGIIRAPQVPSGRMFDALNAGRFKDETVYWDPEQKRLTKFQLQTNESRPGLDVRENEKQFRPHVDYSALEERLPRLFLATTNKKSDSVGIEHADADREPIYSSSTYNYPHIPELGLVSVDRKTEEISFDYDVSNIKNASGCLVEIAYSNRFFEKPNSPELSKKPMKTINLKNTVGHFQLSGKDLKVDGIYSIRVFATGKDGKLLANASDAINCLIYTRPRRT